MMACGRQRLACPKVFPLRAGNVAAAARLNRNGEITPAEPTINQGASDAAPAGRPAGRDRGNEFRHEWRVLHRGGGDA